MNIIKNFWQGFISYWAVNPLKMIVFTVAFLVVSVVSCSACWAVAVAAYAVELPSCEGVSVEPASGGEVVRLDNVVVRKPGTFVFKANKNVLLFVHSMSEQQGKVALFLQSGGKEDQPHYFAIEHKRWYHLVGGEEDFFFFLFEGGVLTAWR